MTNSKRFISRKSGVIFTFLHLSLFLILSACQISVTPTEERIAPHDSELNNQMVVELETADNQVNTPEQIIPSTVEPTRADPWAAVDPSGQKITLWHKFSGDQLRTFKRIVSDFNRTNDWGITVAAESKESASEIYRNMLSSINTPAAPNLVFAYQDQSAVYDLYGGLADMSSLENSPIWGLSELEKLDFFNSSLHADLAPLAGDKRLGFPFSSSVEVLYFNQDWLAELGYSQPPQTPDEFKVITCRASEQPFSKVEEKSVTGYGFSISASQLANWAFSHNGDIFDYDSGRYSFDNEASIQAMRFLQDLILRGCAVIITERYANQEEFGNGKLLFTSGTSAGFPFIEREIEEEIEFEWGVASVPFRTSSPVQNVHYTSFSIPSTNPEAELASWIFLKHLTNPEVQSIWVKSSNQFPVRKSAENGLIEYFNQNPALSAIFQHLEESKYEPAVPGYEFVRELMSESMSAIFIGEDAGQTLSELTAEANTILQDQYVTPLTTMEAIPASVTDD